MDRAIRWGNIAWRTIDWLMLAFVVFHGVHGPADGRRRLHLRRRPDGAHAWALPAARIVLFALGTIVLVTLPLKAPVPVTGR